MLYRIEKRDAPAFNQHGEKDAMLYVGTLLANDKPIMDLYDHIDLPFVRFGDHADEWMAWP